MSTRKFRILAAVAACSLVALVAPARGALAADEEPTEPTPIEKIEMGLVDGLRTAFADPAVARTLTGALAAGEAVDPVTIVEKTDSPGAQAFTRLAAAADTEIKAFLDLPKMAAPSLVVYLADADGQLAKGVSPLFAVAPDEDTEAGSITAQNLDGRPVTIELAKAPAAPVILVNLNMPAVMPEAMAAVSAALNAAGVLSDVLVPVDPPVATRLDRIKLKDDHEPGQSWWCPGDLCAAEIFTLVMGGSNGVARADVVPLYEVNYSGTTYSPNKIIINWQRFSWSQVDLLIMEKDATACQAPYAKYGQAVAGAIAGLASGASYTPLNAAARDALKDKKKICSWPLSYGVNLPDYVDAFDGLTQWSTGTQIGVSNNANTTMSRIVL